MQLVNCTGEVVHILKGTNTTANIMCPPDASVTDPMFGHFELVPYGNSVVPVVSAPSSDRVLNLPAPKADTLYIVQCIIAMAVPEREDFVYPSGAVYNSNGSVKGYRYLARVSRPINALKMYSTAQGVRYDT